MIQYISTCLSRANWQVYRQSGRQLLISILYSKKAMHIYRSLFSHFYAFPSWQKSKCLLVLTPGKWNIVLPSLYLIYASLCLSFIESFSLWSSSATWTLFLTAHFHILLMSFTNFDSRYYKTASQRVETLH